jgi:hypothetical protein
VRRSGSSLLGATNEYNKKSSSTNCFLASSFYAGISLK